MKTLYERTMFKKTISFILIFTFLFSMTGCNKVKKIPADSEKMKSEVSETAQEETSDETEGESETNTNSPEGESKTTTTTKPPTTTTTTTKKTNSGDGGSGGGSSPPTTEPTTKRETTTTTTKPPTTTTTTQASTPERRYDLASEFVTLLNQYRASLGLGTLGVESFMTEYAMLRANDLISDYSHDKHGHDAYAGCKLIEFTHPNVPGQTFKSYEFGAGGECIYYGYGMTPQQALNGFKASSGHNQILTGENYTHVGVGVVSFNGFNYYAVEMYTANFDNNGIYRW